MTRVIKQVTLQMKKPTAINFLPTQGAAIVSTPAFHCPEAVLKNPSSENRSACLNGVIRLFRLGADEELRALDPNIFINMDTRQFPDHLISLLMDYGMFRGEVFTTIVAARDLQAAMLTALEDHGAFRFEDPVTGQPDLDFDPGIPFKNYREALPLCAKLLRERAHPGNLDKADILEIKYNIMGGKLKLASAIADKGLLRNPEVAYFHYAKTLLANPTIGLRSAKNGLKCKESTPAEGEGGRWEEGVAFVTSAWKDSNVFIEEAPPDNRYMSQVLYWNILLGIVIRGPELSDDLKEIQPSLQKLSQADDFKTKVYRLSILKTQLRKAQEAVIKRFAGAVAEWGNVSPDSNSDSGYKEVQNEDRDELTLNRFLDDLHLPDKGCAAKTTSAYPKVNTNRVVREPECSAEEVPTTALTSPQKNLSVNSKGGEIGPGEDDKRMKEEEN
ncbi:hypothetical protein BDP27DRAFT_1363320 [Rhodocollybia butyracea]|uniref:Uncharacterized protein n=1 Tax=Rhodocollybia butyracea TaxID=206335 RepID=A0A9P5PWS8_9AGAR|nr:hypothetical protein BDP27DRAFT_1363320 [Rhodocollybia butyracea]